MGLKMGLMLSNQEQLSDLCDKLCENDLSINIFQGCGVGIVRGSGRQTLGAFIIFFSYYVVALPVGIPLMFKTYLGLAGQFQKTVIDSVELSWICICSQIFKTEGQVKLHVTF